MLSTLAQSKERKGSTFAIWQPCLIVPDHGGIVDLGPVLEEEVEGDGVAGDDEEEGQGMVARWQILQRSIAKP